MDVIQMTRELGKVIQQDEKFLALKAASAANDASIELQEQIQRFSALRMDINRELMKPDKDSAAVSKMDAELKNLYNEITAAPEMIAYNTAKNELDELIAFVTQIITGSANGQNPDTIEPSSGCSGSCSSCSGCS